MEKHDVEWLIKCRQCKHYYQIQADADEVRCRLKYCRFEPKQEIIEIKQLLKQAESEDKK